MSEFLCKHKGWTCARVTRDPETNKKLWLLIEGNNTQADDNLRETEREEEKAEN